MGMWKFTLPMCVRKEEEGFWKTVSTSLWSKKSVNKRTFHIQDSLPLIPVEKQCGPKENIETLHVFKCTLNKREEHLAFGQSFCHCFLFCPVNWGHKTIRLFMGPIMPEALARTLTPLPSFRVRINGTLHWWEYKVSSAPTSFTVSGTTCSHFRQITNTISRKAMMSGMRMPTRISIWWTHACR